MKHNAVDVRDELEMRNLLARYAHNTDAGDLEAFADLFVADASLTRENVAPLSQGGSGLPAETVVGHSKIKELVERAIIKHYNYMARHQMTDVLIEAGSGPDDAKGLCRTLITDWRDGSGKIAMCGTYTVRFVRTLDGWRFKSVSIKLLPS